MKRSLFLGLLGSSALAAGAVRTPDEAAEDAQICQVAAALITAYGRANFSQVAKMMHPRALKLFRDFVTTGYEKYADTYGEALVQDVSGLAEHPKHSTVSDLAFFMDILRLTEHRHPAFSAAKPSTELKIIGGIVDPQGSRTYAHVLFDYRGSIESSQSVTEYRQPEYLTLIQQRDGWLATTCVGASKVLRLWGADLQAAQQKTDAAGKGN